MPEGTVTKAHWFYTSARVQHHGRNTRVRNTHRHAHIHFSHLTKPLNCINKWSSQHSTMVFHWLHAVP